MKQVRAVLCVMLAFAAVGVAAEPLGCIDDGMHPKIAVDGHTGAGATSIGVVTTAE